jgi:hypothetical protein
VTHADGDPRATHPATTSPSPTSAQRTPLRTPAAPTKLARTRFVQLSAALTGFDEAELYGTGMVDVYLGTLTAIVGDGMVGRLLQRWADAAAASADAGDLDQRLPPLLADDTLGPLARNLAFVWYTGQWNQLPAVWRDTNGANALDQTFIISPEAYAQGLVWQAIGTHPQGAKMPGYGSWALRPEGTTS